MMVLYCLIFLFDTFLALHSTNFAGYTNANNLFVNRYNINDVILGTEKTGERFLAWFSNNKMKLNTDKCHLLLNTHENNVIMISKKLLGVDNFDYNFKFNIHMEGICNKASCKLAD